MRNVDLKRTQYLYDKARTLAANIELLNDANQIRMDMIGHCALFGAENGILLSLDPLVKTERLELQKQNNRIQHIMSDIENNKLGIRPNSNYTDIDVMGDPSMTPDEKAQYSGLGGVFTLIVLGVVVVAGLIIHEWMIYEALEKERNDKKKILEYANSKFCSDPRSEVCAKWIETKNRNDFEAKTDLISKIEAALKKVGEEAREIVKKGGSALVVMLPLLLLFFAWGKK